MADTIKQTFPSEHDQAAQEVFEQQQRELRKYQTRYVYVPLYDVACPQIENGYVPAGVIHPIPAPRGKINVKLLPEGAQVLYVTSPSVGVRRDPSMRRTHSDPAIAALIEELERMKQQALDRGQEPPNIAVYLHETGPIINAITSTYGHQGAVEVRALAGMPVNAFNKHEINDHLFWPESVKTVTAAKIRVQMLKVAEQGKAQKGEAARVLTLITQEILASVEQCERHCDQHVSQRHLEMDDPQSDAPKRYNQRDLRAIEFIGATKRNEYLQKRDDEQRQMMAAVPQMLEESRRQNERLAEVMSEMANLLKAQTEVLKSSASKKG
jgi:hypothetical protein